MANLIDIRRRIRSVKNTQQITKAMKMVAAAKLRRSQERILSTRPYALELGKVVARLADRQSEESHPLLQQREEKRVLLVVVTGDRGLAGSFNATVIRRTSEVLKRYPEAELLLLGKKGADFFARRPVKIRNAYRSLFSNVAYEDARTIAQDIAKAYTSGEYDAVYLIYNEFKSILQQKLSEERLLPISAPEVPAGSVAGAASEAEYLFEPAAGMILADLLPRFLAFQVYRALLESQASEHAARMNAMSSATKNAGEMISGLTLTYNRARQAQITTQLIEVVSGANALEG
ncbi:MAG: ATP synthase F1 subunit gamma [Thermoanaerobaculia bacterium]|nr:ATP synthase F1 subunit gamma [Thermoanaerobaculia bacterium]